MESYFNAKSVEIGWFLHFFVTYIDIFLLIGFFQPLIYKILILPYIVFNSAINFSVRK